jgi:hypothetical protein
LPAELRVKYFDTIAPATSICLMRKGFLFAASEFGDHALYQFSVRAGAGRWDGSCFGRGTVMRCSNHAP